MNQCKCPICTSDAQVSFDGETYLNFYECPVCGRFQLSDFDDKLPFNINHLASYLTYHAYKHEGKIDYRYNTVMAKEKCDMYKQEFDKGRNIKGIPVHMDSDIVELWYPRSFSERIDTIVSYIGSNTKHFGQKLKLTPIGLYGVLFVDIHDYNPLGYRGSNDIIERNKLECLDEASNILKYLKDMQLVDYRMPEIKDEQHWWLSLMPEGYKRFDENQKNSSYGRGVLVAMRFGEETKQLREAIRKGITDAGYIAIFIDEVQHNDFITPELLKHIRDSRFVVADLTHQNNGAYFEEGYAMGLGKPVIQLCKSGVQLHFDVAQKNTIIWKTEEEIPERLKNRIVATIG